MCVYVPMIVCGKKSEIVDLSEDDGYYKYSSPLESTNKPLRTSVIKQKLERIMDKKKIMEIKKFSIIAFRLVILITAFSSFQFQKDHKKPTPPGTPPTNFAKGADISWITEMEFDGRKLYNADGTEMEGFALMKSLGMNTIRLRVWVNPSPAWNNTADVI